MLRVGQFLAVHVQALEVIAGFDDALFGDHVQPEFTGNGSCGFPGTRERRGGQHNVAVTLVHALPEVRRSGLRHARTELGQMEIRHAAVNDGVRVVNLAMAQQMNGRRRHGYSLSKPRLPPNSAAS